MIRTAEVILTLNAMRCVGGRDACSKTLRPHARLGRYRRTYDLGSQMELLPDVHARLLEHARAGDALCERGAYADAAAEYNDAWRLLPSPKHEWDAATWLLVAIGDAYFRGRVLTSARKAFEYATRCPGGLGNPFVHTCEARRGGRELRIADGPRREWLPVSWRRADGVHGRSPRSSIGRHVPASQGRARGRGRGNASAFDWRQRRHGAGGRGARPAGGIGTVRRLRGRPWGGAIGRLARRHGNDLYTRPRMNGNTIATLHQLFNTNWFCNVGVHDTTSARVLSTWHAAVASCTSPEWEDLHGAPGFFAAQAYWYSVGHFPCGWDGEFPAGTRIIY